LFVKTSRFATLETRQKIYQTMKARHAARRQKRKIFGMLLAGALNPKKFFGTVFSEKSLRFFRDHLQKSLRFL
jgi:hypothetical protein